MVDVAGHDPEYIAARRVLLDALEALGAQRKAIVLVGAQAIYLRVGAGDMAGRRLLARPRGSKRRWSITMSFG
jgi:hypothetical protein